MDRGGDANGHCGGTKQTREEVISYLMEEYGDAILRMCFLYLGEKSMAEDVVQETFIKAYQKFHLFQGDSNIKTWLMRIAINTCKDYRRSKWNRVIDGKVALDSVCATYEDQHKDDVVLAELMRLPENYKAVVLLYYYQNMKTKEIAYTLGISLAAVSSRLLRAKKLLYKKLERWYFDE